MGREVALSGLAVAPERLPFKVRESPLNDPYAVPQKPVAM
jgi:hypothetical protein